MTNDHVTATEKNLKKNSKKFVDRNGDVVPLPMYSGGENRAHRPTHKFSSADEIK